MISFQAMLPRGPGRTEWLTILSHFPDKAHPPSPVLHFVVFLEHGHDGYLPD